MINLFRIRAVSDQLVADGLDFQAAAPRQADGAPDSANVLFEGLVDAHYRRTYSLIYRMVRSESDAADLTQEVFVRVYRALPRLRAEGAAAAWIRRIATNLCLDFIRRRQAGPATTSLDASLGGDPESSAHLNVSDPSGEPDRLFASSESVRVLHRAINSLPEDYRTVVLLHHIEEMRVEEIAHLFHVPTGTIKSRLSRARRELRRKLTPYFLL